jgi:ABC-type nitrate/sulfonate/bicarbonate transport system substrate-binding protein
MAGVNESPNFVLVSRKFADENPEAVVRYVATLIDLGDLIRAKPDEAANLAAAEISKKGIVIEPKALQLALTRIKMDPRVTDELLGELVPVAESMKAAGKISNVPDFKKLVRTTYYDQALKLSQSTN